MCRRLALFLLFLVVCLVLLTAWWVSRRGTTPAFPTPRHYTAAEAKAAEARLEEALGLTHRGRARTAAATRPASAPGVTSVRLSQDDINATLATNPDIQRQLASHGIQSAQIQLSPPDTVTAFVSVLYHGSPMDVQISGALAAQPGGDPTFEVHSVQAGAIPVPLSSVRSVIDKASTSLLAKAMPLLPLTVEQVSVQGKDLVLTGSPKRATRH